MPRHNTYRRVLAGAVGAVLQAPPGVGRRVLVSIDGTTVRGTIRDAAPQGEQLPAASLPAGVVVLMQVAAGEQDHEIRVAPHLFGALDRRGQVVVGDAMHSQRAMSSPVVAAGGEYRWIAKGHQPALRADIADRFALDNRTVAGGLMAQDRRTVTIGGRGHGRQERRTITASRDLHSNSDGEGLDPVVQVKRSRTSSLTGTEPHEVPHGLTSLTPAQAGARGILLLSRVDWGIENGLHRCRTVTFHENATKLTQGQAGRVMAALNTLVIGLLRLAGGNPIWRRPAAGIPPTWAARWRCSLGPADQRHARSPRTAASTGPTPRRLPPEPTERRVRRRRDPTRDRLGRLT